MDDRQQRGSGLPVPPARQGTHKSPWDKPAPQPIRQYEEVDTLPSGGGGLGFFRRHLMSVAMFALLSAGVLIQAYRDLSRPDAFDYWKDLYSTPSMTTQTVDNVELDGRRRTALVLRGKIGPAAASWFRERVDEAHLKPGDLVLLSSPGGDLGQSIIMGEFIRARGLVTAVGTTDTAGQIRPGSCASACRVSVLPPAMWNSSSVPISRSSTSIDENVSMSVGVMLSERSGFMLICSW